VKFFFDNMMSEHLARAVAEIELGHDRNTVVHLSEKFDRSISDVDWISALGQERDWVIVSGDLRISRNPAERRAWLESGLTTFFLKAGWGNQRIWTYAARFFYWWPSIVLQAHMAARGKGFYVPWGGQRFEDVRR
jgi:hypothetical protein